MEGTKLTENEPWRRWIGVQYITGTKTVETIEKRFSSLLSRGVKYACGQWEQCPSTEKIHFQFYLELNKPMRFSGVKKSLMYKDTNWNMATKSREAGRAYALKTESDSKGTRMDGTAPIEIGEWTGKQGQRSDLLSVKNAIDNGMAEDECWNEFFDQMVRHHKAFKQYRISTKSGRRDEPKIQILYGGSGTGKSAYCQLLEDLQGKEFFWLSAPADGKGRNSRLWWDGYNGEETVVIDEFYGWMPYNFLLRMLDRTKVNVEVKGGSVPLRATNFIFTSNTHPNEWYNYDYMPYQGKPFWRRVDDWGTITHTGDEPGEFLENVLWNFKNLQEA